MTTQDTPKNARTPTNTGIPAPISSDYKGNFGLEHRDEICGRVAEPYLPDGLPVAELTQKLPANKVLPLSHAEIESVRETYDGFSKRTRHVLTVRLGLGVPQQTCRRAAEPLKLHQTRVKQLQAYALDALALAVEGRKTERSGLRAAIIESLSLMVKGGDDAGAA